MSALALIDNREKVSWENLWFKVRPHEELGMESHI